MTIIIVKEVEEEKLKIIGERWKAEREKKDIEKE